MQQLEDELVEQALPVAQSASMPAGEQSLRAAIRKAFEGKKKRLAEEYTAQQECASCKKKGHSAQGCPDRTQPESRDKGDNDMGATVDEETKI